MLTEPRVLAVLSVCTLLAVVAIGRVDREPPEVLDATEGSGFTPSRAFDDLRWIAKEPHPMGSLPHREVRSRLARELETIGLEVRVEGGFVAPHGVLASRARFDWVENVVARLPGSEGAAAVLVVSHYDSAGTAPGAGDDGAAVAAMLEVARVLAARVAAGRSPRNDVIFLFTDGEEIELLGARHHVAAGSWREKTAAVLNFEARGASGPSILFETSEGNARFVKVFAETVARPVASSFAYEVYRRMPNDTDFTIFKAAGWRGLNFAFIGSHERYHTADDTFESLDGRSLVHHGTTMLALTERLADSDLAAPTGEEADADRVFFGLLGARTIHYPLALQYLLNLAAILFFAGALVVAWRRRRIDRRSLAWGVAAHAIGIVAAAAASALLVRLVVGIDDSSRVEFWRVVHDGPMHFPAHVLLAISIATFTLLQLRGRTGADGAFAGALAITALALVVATFAAPAGSYVLAWPLLASTAAFLAFVTRPRKGRIGAARFAILALSLLPTASLVVPLLHFAAQALTFAAAPVAIVAVLIASLPATPLFLCAMAVSRLALPIVTAAAAWLTLGWAVWNGSLATETPRSSRVEYVVEGATGAAAFVSSEPAELRGMFPGALVAEVESETLIPGSGKAKRGRVAAEPHSIAEATFEWMGSTIESDRRVCEFRMRIPEGASSVTVSIAKESRAWIASAAAFEPAPEPAAAFAATQAGDDGAKWAGCEIRVRGVPRDAVVVKIAQPIAVPLEVTIVTRRYGLPPLPEGASPPRPWRVPAFWAADESVIHRTLTF